MAKKRVRSDRPESREDRRARRAVLVVALLITAAAYANVVPGEFVYDDDIQIVRNPHIQEGRHFWKAMTSDVWAFKGERAEAWSNYWRPMFNLWLIVNHRLFGLDPAPWHVTNILLHAVVIVLAAGVLRRLEVRPAASAAVLWIFAAHPVHTEAVGWISGSPDLLSGVFLLGSYAAYLAHRASPRPGPRPASLLLYCGAAASKEVGLVFPAVIFVSEWALADEGTPNSRRFIRSLKAAGPYLAIAILFLIARVAVLGMLARSTSWAPGGATVLLSLPGVLVFYLRQLFWPATLGPTYPVRAVEPEAVGPTSFWLPLLVVALVAAAVVSVWRRGAIYKIGIAFGVVLLAPAMNIPAFLPEQIVHDRYLYLPLFGALMVASAAVLEIAAKLRPRSGPLVDRAIYGGALILALLLASVTVRYNRVWLSNVALWERAVEVDPGSSLALGQLGNVYRRSGRIPEAKQYLERASEVDPDVTQVILDLGIIALGERRFREAEERFRRVLSVYPDNEVALDQLGATYAAEGRATEATAVFVRARDALPYRRLKYTLNIAVLSAQTGDPVRALAELESVRGELERETDPALLRGYYYLGELYHGAGRKEEANRAYLEFLRKTEGARGNAVAAERDQARQRLAE